MNRNLSAEAADIAQSVMNGTAEKPDTPPLITNMRRPSRIDEEVSPGTVPRGRETEENVPPGTDVRSGSVVFLGKR
jgi:hypothetical protein